MQRQRARVLVVLVAIFAALPLPARATGDFKLIADHLLSGTPLDFTPAGTQPGLGQPILANDDCEVCHGQPSDEVDRRVLPFNSWAGSMMANAGRDPLFWAALDVANADEPITACAAMYLAHGCADMCARTA